MNQYLLENHQNHKHYQKSLYYILWYCHNYLLHMCYQMNQYLLENHQNHKHYQKSLYYILWYYHNYLLHRYYQMNHSYKTNYLPLYLLKIILKIMQTLFSFSNFLKFNY